MGLNAFGLGFLFTATDLASGVMSNVNKNFKGLEEQAGKSIGNLDEMTKKLGAGLAVTAIGVGGLAATFAVTGKAAEFEQALAAVGAVSNASAEDMKLLKSAAIQAGKATQFSPTEAVLGLNELAQAGYTVKESIELLTPTLGLAAGSLGDLSPAEAAGLASQGLKAFGIDASLASRMVDQLLQSSNEFAVKPKDLALGLGTMSSGAQTLNQSLTETVLAFGLVKNVIPGTERAATAVKTAFEQLALPKVQHQMKGLGVSVLDANGGFRSFFDIMKDLQPKLAKMSEGEKSAFLIKAFGKEGLSGINAIFAQLDTGIKGADDKIRKGADAIDYLKSGLTAANGVQEVFTEKLLNTFEGSKKLMSGSMETFAILIGEPFMNAWRPVIDVITWGLNNVIDFLDALSPEVKDFAAMLVVGGFALLTVVGVILLAQAAWPLLVIGFGLLTGAMGGLAVSAAMAVLSLWPFILVGAAIAAIVYAVQHNIGGLGETWDKVVEAFAGGGNVLKGIFDGIVSYLTPLWEVFKDAFATVFDEFGPIFQDVGFAVDELMAAFSDLGEQFNMTSDGPGEGMIGFVKTLAHFIAGLIGTVVSLVGWLIVVGAAIVRVFSGVVTFVQGIADSISFWVDKIVWLINKVNEVADIISGVMGKGTSKGERGMPGAPKEHAGDAAGRSKTRGLGGPTTAPVPEPTTLADQGKNLGLTPASSVGSAVAALSDQDTRPGVGIDYEKMAAANSKQPINVALNVDGEKLAQAVARGQRTTAARSGHGDVDEP